MSKPRTMGKRSWLQNRPDHCPVEGQTNMEAVRQMKARDLERLNPEKKTQAPLLHPAKTTKIPQPESIFDEIKRWAKRWNRKK